MSLHSYTPQSGRFLKEDGTVVDITDAFNDQLKAFISGSVFQRFLVEGKAFHGWVKYSLDVGATAYLQIKTGASPVFFAVDNLATDGEKIAVVMLEAPTLTDGLTAVPLINRDRNSNATSNVLVYSDPTGVTGGVQIDELYAGGSFTLQGVGGEQITGVLPFKLKPNTDYVLAITNNGSAASSCLIKFTIIETE